MPVALEPKSIPIKPDATCVLLVRTQQTMDDVNSVLLALEQPTQDRPNVSHVDVVTKPMQTK